MSELLLFICSSQFFRIRLATPFQEKLIFSQGCVNEVSSSESREEPESERRHFYDGNKKQKQASLILQIFQDFSPALSSTVTDQNEMKLSGIQKEGYSHTMLFHPVLHSISYTLPGLFWVSQTKRRDGLYYL